MTRPRKATVDYFPHDCHHGKTMFILEEKYGNDGYAFWFKLLEMLGSSENHFIDCRKPAALMFLQAKTRLSEKTIIDILDLLATLEAISPKYWESKIIWSANFIKNISPVYTNRKVETPLEPDNYTQITASEGITTSRLPVDNRRVDESRVEYSKVDEKSTCAPEAQQETENGKSFDRFWNRYPRKAAKPSAKKAWATAEKKKDFPGIEKVLDAIDLQKTWQQWATDNGKFIPYPTTWINREGWNDEPPVSNNLSNRTYSNLKNAWEFANE